MKLAIATVSLGGPLRARLEAAARAGFHGIEFFHADCLASGLPFRDIGTICRDLGLGTFALQPFRGFEGDSGDPFHQGMDRFRRFLDDASELGTSVVGLCANESPTACGPEDAATLLARLADIAAARDIVLAFEALSWSHAIHDLPGAWEAVRTANAQNLGLVLDSFHLGIRNQSLALLKAIPIRKIAAVQLSTCEPAAGTDYKYLSRNHRVLPSPTDPFVTSLTSLLVEGGYDGVLTLECFNAALSLDEPLPVARRALESLINLVGPSATCRDGTSAER